MATRALGTQRGGGLLEEGGVELAEEGDMVKASGKLEGNREGEVVRWSKGSCHRYVGVEDLHHFGREIGGERQRTMMIKIEDNNDQESSQGRSFEKER